MGRTTCPRTLLCVLHGVIRGSRSTFACWLARVVTSSFMHVTHQVCFWIQWNAATTKILSTLALDFDSSRKQVHMLTNCKQFIFIQQHEHFQNLSDPMCCLYKMKSGTRRTAETTTKFLNNGLKYMYVFHCPVTSTTHVASYRAKFRK